MTNPLRFLGRHVGASIAGGVAIAALAGGGIAYAATSPGSPSPASAPAVKTPTTTAPAAGGTHEGAKHAHGVRGTITAINGDSWTLQTPKGQSVTVTISPQTQFGTKKAPATASTFKVGETATVLGQRSGATVDATRVIIPLHPIGSGATSPTTAAG